MRITSERSPTLLDVARTAGVSTATVSRCLNDPGLVQPATRTRVETAIETLGYTPHFGARALASNRTNTIGAIIPTMDNSIFARGLQAFQEELSAAGVTMLVASSGYDTEQEAEQIRTLVERGADGLLLIGRARSAKTFDYLRQRKVPFVIAWNYRNDKKNLYVGFNNRKAAKELAQHVLEKGHRHIAMIAGLTRDNDRAADRVTGCREAITEAGIAASDLRVIETAYSIEDARDSFKHVMALAPETTAIICGNDVLAAGAIQEAHNSGLRVPDDISIVGFDNIELSTVVEPNLTTVHVPHRRMGQTAAQLLLQLRDTDTPPKSIEFQTHIVERGSLGPPPKANRK